LEKKLDGTAGSGPAREVKENTNAYDYYAVFFACTEEQAEENSSLLPESG
jgi:hypothetical protein